jgi:hypothetical protein
MVAAAEARRTLAEMRTLEGKLAVLQAQVDASGTDNTDLAAALAAAEAAAADKADALAWAYAAAAAADAAASERLKVEVASLKEQLLLASSELEAQTALMFEEVTEVRSDT